MGSGPGWQRRVYRLLAPVPGAVPLARVVAETAVVAWRYRAVGLSAEAAFFLLLSLPPLLLALVAGAGFASDFLGEDTLGTLRAGLETWALRFLTPEAVQGVLLPTFDVTLSAGRGDVLSVSFLITLWSGSRSLHVFLDTIKIMYGQRLERGPLRARLLSLTTYLASVLVLGLTLPLLLIGPRYLTRWLPQGLDWMVSLYWPVVGLVGIASLTGLYHVATPKRSPFVRDLPGALLAVALWVLGSVLIRVWAQLAVGGPSVFGPLSAPIILMVYLFFLSLAVLFGASLNAAIRRLWPPPEYRGPRARINEWLEERRSSRADEDDEAEGQAGEGGATLAVRTDIDPDEEEDGIRGPH